MRVFVIGVLLAVVVLLAGDVSGGGVGSKCAGRRSAPCDSGLKVSLLKGQRHRKQLHLPSMGNLINKVLKTSHFLESLLSLFFSPFSGYLI